MKKCIPLRAKRAYFLIEALVGISVLGIALAISLSIHSVRSAAFNSDKRLQKELLHTFAYLDSLSLSFPPCAFSDSAPFFFSPYPGKIPLEKVTYRSETIQLTRTVRCQKRADLP